MVNRHYTEIYNGNVLKEMVCWNFFYSNWNCLEKSFQKFSPRSAVLIGCCLWTDSTKSQSMKLYLQLQSRIYLFTISLMQQKLIVQTWFGTLIFLYEVLTQSCNSQHWSNFTWDNTLNENRFNILPFLEVCHIFLKTKWYPYVCL